MGPTLTRPSATLSHPMGEGRGEGFREANRRRSEYFRTVTRVFAGLAAVCLLSGCLSGNPGITILNLETGRQVIRTVPGSFNELPIDVDAAGKTFRTIQRSETNSLVLRTVNFQGKTKTEKAFPIPDSALEAYGSTWAYAISPKGDAVAYLDASSHELRIYDFASKSSRTIASPAGGSSVQVSFLFWTDGGRLIFGAHDLNAVEHDLILLVDSNTGTQEILAQPVALAAFQNALSPSGRFLAYWEGTRRSSMEGRLVLYDLASRTPVGVVKSMSGKWLSRPQWNVHEDCLAYEEGARQIMMYAVTDRTSYVVAEAATNQMVYLNGFGSREVLYKTSPKMGSPMDEPLRIRDVYGPKERQIAGVRINGPAFVVENGAILIAKTGF